MGSPDNITEETLKRLAQGKDLNQFKKDLLSQLQANNLDPKLETEFVKAAKAWGQSVEEAKKNTALLLKEQLG
jgi:hypothetical protein